VPYSLMLIIETDARSVVLICLRIYGVNCCSDKSNNRRGPKESWNNLRCWTYRDTMAVLSFVIRPFLFIFIYLLLIM